jgi:malonyl-CoA/methylmalonyl-CoA synthetase
MAELLPLFQRAKSCGHAIALRSEEGEHSYADIVARSAAIAATLLDGAGDLQESRVAFLLPAGFDYVTTQWAVWRAGGVAVPLCTTATTMEREYVLCDAQVACLVTTGEFASLVEALCIQLGIRLVLLENVSAEQFVTFPAVEVQRRAMILYTSGTTSKPKGVVTTHGNIQSQIESLVEAWHWQRTDSIPLFLPLHHIHGIINILACGLWVGATVETFPKFEMEKILGRVEAGAYSVFMAVPTIYVKLIQALEAMPAADRARATAGFAKMRLMVSGSAALPASVHAEWSQLTGQKLLERYGMTEIGMALSNPYEGERRPGSVGFALPGVEVRLVSEQQTVVMEEDLPGEIQVRGPGVFLEYWNRPAATAELFTDGWFRTGDVAVREHGYYRILGRQSVDIIKSGGYKLSALEIEAALLEHPAIRECAVIGVADTTWGEAVAAVVVLATPGETLALEALRSWCRERLSNYKIPQRLLVVDALPRNAMGKVTKTGLRELFAN